MYRCDDCNTDFETPKLVKDSESGDFHVCPHCGKSDYYEIIECPECGKTEYVEDMPLYCGMCRECFIEKYSDTIGFSYYLNLSEHDKRDAIKYIYCIRGHLYGNAFKALEYDLSAKFWGLDLNSETRSSILSYLKEFCFSDLTAFAEWCEDNEVFKNG